jgi:NTP pyrophosphatase (non-canonical NTP hydrolase)
LNLDDIRRRAIAVRAGYDELNRREGRREWDTRDYMLGFVGDVGDLAKLVTAADGARAAVDLPGALEHELADCLWSVVILADRLNIDLEDAFGRTMNDLEAYIAARSESDG